MIGPFPYETDALVVHQPLGSFYVAVLPVWVLLETCYADRATAVRTKDGTGYRIEGSQRLERDARLVQIAEYVNGTESAFPNSIILAANFNYETGLQLAESEDDASAPQRWKVTANPNSNTMRLTIPTKQKLAPIIDGQHRLFSFTKAKPDRSSSTELICSIFIDLPKPFQANLFATINSTQKAVDRSLTYELFGYNVDSEPSAAWSPEKVSVFFARRLNTEDGSPLRGHILVAAENDFALTRSEARKQGTWVVSMATVVQGIVRLISTNPKDDANGLQIHPVEKRDRASLIDPRRDGSPLRSLYVGKNDALLYTTVQNFLVAIADIIWSKNSFDSYDKKTVGVQAIFDILRQLAPDAIAAKDVSVEYFRERLRGAARVNFDALALQVPSGVGRRLIRITLQRCCNLSHERLSEEDEAKVMSAVRHP